jgi:predicted SAM-dependent methyltransferase
MRDIGNTEFELACLARDVDRLLRSSQPIKIYAGAGDTLRKGFLNFDIRIHANVDPHDPRWADHDLYVFPFADQLWPIPDGSVDFIFSEDFFEHINQKQQICFLAECFRVLRPGAYNRINTPCLANSMQRHSNFSRGFRGVFRGEWDNWHHVSLVTRGMLEELARIVGYRGIVFNQKGQSVSLYRCPEGRPGPDRDPIFGNVMADLLK